MKRRSFKLKCCKFDYDSLRRLTPYINKHPDQGVCQINSVNLNLTASINYKARAFFNYITGGAKAPPAPMVAPPLNHFGPPSQSPFSGLLLLLRSASNLNYLSD